jgi:large subunit ribosomal protein L30
MPEKTQPEKKLRITLVKSAIGYSEKHKATVRALGLRRLNQTVEHVDSPTLRGMLYKVNHLVLIEEQVEK